jgi:hypothetical protein
MFSVLMKPKPWIVASLLVAASAFAAGKANDKNCKSCPKASKECPKPCPQPNPPTQICPKNPDPCCPAWPVPVLNAAYNYPAAIKTRCPWDMCFDVSFIYWQPIQENMELGVDGGSVPDAVSVGNVIQADTDFKPGFHVGLGGKFDYDNWCLHADYTWFHSTHSQDYASTVGNGISTIQAAPIEGADSAGFSDVSQKWRLNMDIAELTLGRPHYVGTKFVVNPTFGLRGAWIRQYLNNAYVGSADGDYNRNQQIKSWALGPQIGLDGCWDICGGFRFFGNAEADILYTRYTTLSSQFVSGDTDYTVVEDDYGALRTHLDLELGLGWGTYLNCNSWYLDFSAGYGFQVFFDQNMFRNFTEAATLTSLSPNGNLYIQGMRLKFSLDF